MTSSAASRVAAYSLRRRLHQHCLALLDGPAAQRGTVMVDGRRRAQLPAYQEESA